MLSQAKIDLAVLYKLHQHAEAGGAAITPDDAGRLFQIYVPHRRIELALSELEGRGDVDREYHPHFSDEGLWQISRGGLQTVDRALRAPASFIARLHANGDSWLESDEAKGAVLKKIGEPEIARGPIKPPEPTPPVSPLKESRRQIDWTKWGTILTAVGILVTILIWTAS